jgi:hypothetical protein
MSCFVRLYRQTDIRSARTGLMLQTIKSGHYEHVNRLLHQTGYYLWGGHSVLLRNYAVTNSQSNTALHYKQKYVTYTKSTYVSNIVFLTIKYCD